MRPKISKQPPPTRHEQVVAGFNLYRMPGIGDALDEIQVSTCYNGVVLQGPARVVAASGHQVILEVSDEHAKALSHTRLAFVESPVHGTSFRARVVHARPAPCEISLSGFVPFREYIGRRGEARVTPVHAMVARLSNDSQEVHGRVVDLSSKALAAILDVRALEHIDLPETELVVDVWGEHEVSDRLTDFKATGRIIRTERPGRISPLLCKAVVALNLYPALERTLNCYIARRHREILVALETGSD